jgi:stress response protein YsnF
MDTAMTMDRLLQLKGKPIYSNDGEKIGKVEDIYVDNDTRQPEWIGLGTGIFGTKHVLVPVEGAHTSQDGLQVPYAKDLVKDTPDIDSDEISEDTENELYEHYGMRRLMERASQRRQGEQFQATQTARQTPPTTRPATGDNRDSMTLSEEQLHVGKREVDAGRVRLRKYVETEPASQDVELRRETVSINREPINQPVRGAEIGEHQIETQLRREEPVVE